MKLSQQLFWIGVCCLVATLGVAPHLARAQEETPSATPEEESEEITLQAEAGDSRRTLIDKTISFDITRSTIPDGAQIERVEWNFGDGVAKTGETVTHTYLNPGSYLLELTLVTDQGISEDTTEVRVFDRVIVLLTDSSVPAEQLALAEQQAAEFNTLLLMLHPQSDGPEALVEDELTQALLTAREEFGRSAVVVAWTSGSLGTNVLSRFSQTIKQSSETSLNELAVATKGVVVISSTPFAVLSPTAQSMFDQLEPAYVLLTRPEALPLIVETETADDARTSIISSPIGHQLLGSFSSRAVTELGITNFMSFGINYLINGGVPINNIILILMIPVIATILSFARQVVGIKAFGLITPAMTTLSFLVLGLQTGLIVFVVILLSGTVTRLLLRRFRLLYLPRMGLVLTNASLAILIMLGVGAATGSTAALSFSIFPILILTILAEEFIAVQFSRGFKTALRITAWTLILSILCYYIVSWELLRTILLSYPETMLLAIPINIALGRFTGLRLTEYVRFRELLRYGPPAE